MKSKTGIQSNLETIKDEIEPLRNRLKILRAKPIPPVDEIVSINIRLGSLEGSKASLEWVLDQEGSEEPPEEDLDKVRAKSIAYFLWGIVF